MTFPVPNKLPKNEQTPKKTPKTDIKFSTAIALEETAAL
jgi:hypothetical protein